MKDVIIGIDLGTTNSEVAVFQNSRAEIIKVDDFDILPSVVGMGINGEIIVGYSAKNQAVVQPENTIKSIKRKMGTDEKIKLGNKEYSPQEISSFILKKLKTAAENYLGHSVKRAVITVPAYFTDAQKKATREAGELAGLTVERIINEPTASSLIYEVNQKDSKNIIVYDLGGGTFDVSVVTIQSGIIEVKATSGDNFLGGDDFDNLFYNYL